MAFDARVLKVMIASPSDILDERQVVRDAIAEWNCIHSEDRKLVLLPIGWETHSSPTMGDRPQAIINKQVLEDCDLLVAVFWTRLGSPTGVAVSGTVEEIQEHVKSGKPAMIYFSEAPVRLDSVDEKQYTALKEFKEKCCKEGLVESYDSLDEFRDKFSRQLSQKIIHSYPSIGQSSADVSPSPRPELSLSNEAKELLLSATTDNSATVMRTRIFGGLSVQAGNQNFVIQDDARSEARWEAAIRELEELGLIKDRGHKHEVFSVTDEGFQMADLLSSS